MHLAAVVLAAGSGSRYSRQPGAKLLADLDGEPLLSHVLRAVREFGPAVTVVVLGHGADEIEERLTWSGELRIRNGQPGRGLASSVATGIGALEARSDSFDGAFIVLGDQPRLQAAVMFELARAAARARPADRPLVVPRYDREPGPRNPVLLLRPAWSLVDDLADDEGFSALIRESPDMVQVVPVAGGMPDVDRPEDLELARTWHLIAGKPDVSTAR